MGEHVEAEHVICIAGGRRMADSNRTADARNEALYFEGEDYLTSDAVNAVRDGLIATVERTDDAVIATSGFVLESLPAE